MDVVKELEESQKEDQDSTQERLDKTEEMLMGMMKQLRAIRVSQEIRDEKENQLLAAKSSLNHQP